MKKKMAVPEVPPDVSNILPEILTLNTLIAARYIGGASLIKLKTPSEGFAKQGKLLKQIRGEYQKTGEKVYMLGPEQQAISQAGVTTYCNFGGHGSGICRALFMLQYNILFYLRKISSSPNECQG